MSSYIVINGVRYDAVLTDKIDQCDKCAFNGACNSVYVCDIMSAVIRKKNIYFVKHSRPIVTTAKRPVRPKY